MSAVQTGPLRPAILPAGKGLGLCALGLSGMRQRGGILQVWLPAAVLYVSLHSSRLMTGQLAGRNTITPWGSARTSVVVGRRQWQMFLEFPNRIQNC